MRTSFKKNVFVYIVFVINIQLHKLVFENNAELPIIHGNT